MSKVKCYRATQEENYLQLKHVFVQFGNQVNVFEGTGGVKILSRRQKRGIHYPFELHLRRKFGKVNTSRSRG
ncbi:MAG: hypothetical protein P8M80_05725 [Pirellulaceae bacterium]|nr:hypothetical protein [Pirellulaceae bacterium]